MAAADDDAANGQARKKSTKAKMAPGEGLPANLYEKVKLAIYQSHGKSIIAATMQAKLDECHGPFQLQKFLIRWGGQFSKLAMFGVRLEMMATARSAADLTDHDPPEDPPENFGKDFKQAMMKHAAIARATREEHAARAQQLQEQWAAIMAVLDEEEAALDEGRAKRITNRRARSRTTAKSLGNSVNDPQENPDSRQGSRPRSRSGKGAKPTTPKVKKTGKGANYSIVTHASTSVLFVQASFCARVLSREPSGVF